MYQGYILNLNRSDNSVLHRLGSILQSNFNCRVTVLNEDDAFAKNGRKPPPNLIFLLADNSDINWQALPFDLNSVPTIMVLSAENSSNKTSDDLPCQIDDVIIPPFKDIEVIWKSRRLLKKRSSGKTPAIKESLFQELGLNNIIGKNPAFLKTLTKIPLLADSNATILITGETGVGKELVARATHYLSPRQNKSFVAINCGAIPASLVENELFGHKRGAFPLTLQRETRRTIGPTFVPLTRCLLCERSDFIHSAKRQSPFAISKSKSRELMKMGRE